MELKNQYNIKIKTTLYTKDLFIHLFKKSIKWITE